MDLTSQEQPSFFYISRTQHEIFDDAEKLFGAIKQINTQFKEQMDTLMIEVL